MASAVDFEKVLLRTLWEDAGLSVLVGNKVFALVIPQGTKLPCVTFQRLGGSPANTLSGASGLEEIDLQIDAWARDYDEAKAIAKAVRAAMPPSGPQFSAHLIEDQDLYEDGTNYFRVSMGYTVWFLETE
ncbi:DUF3168 domain-containing protein [Bilophila wadsworthia]|uniref:DUF3168 domain-containing protein n=1 Tax=Bilophila wadsworthia TaxID=35833 RepID=UPI001D6D734F|nr:DUF3168 domain-containing protein [Bilophila wadsworthia]MBS5377548.1 DUF3168 domain-containing protein [Bilophila wadsworthia]